MNQVKKIRLNSFSSPVSRSAGVDHSDDLVEVTELVDFAEMGPSGDKSDFVIIKKPVVVETYHMNKVLEERCKGASLKEILQRCEQCGDFSTLNQRKVVFGDGFETPSTLGDALDKHIASSNYIDSLGPEKVNELLKVSKFSDEEFKKYVDGLVAEKLAKMQPSTQQFVKDGDSNGK